LAQHNAGFLYAHDDTSLHDVDVLREGDAAQRRALHKKAMLYFQQAAVQGSVEAQVQLAVLIAGPQPAGAGGAGGGSASSSTAAAGAAPDYALANRLFTEAAQAGSRDAVWHLGYHHLHGRGVPRDSSRAWELMAQAGFASKHATLGGAEKALFRAAKAIYEARALLMVGAAFGALAASGRADDPIGMVRSIFGSMGGGLPTPGADGEASWEADDDDFDDFSDDREE